MVMRRKENPVDKTGFGPGVSALYAVLFWFEPPSNITAIILNNPAPQCDRQTLHIHTYNPVHYI